MSSPELQEERTKERRLYDEWAKTLTESASETLSEKTGKFIFKKKRINPKSAEGVLLNEIKLLNEQVRVACDLADDTFEGTFHRPRVEELRKAHLAQKQPMENAFDDPKEKDLKPIFLALKIIVDKATKYQQAAEAANKAALTLQARINDTYRVYSDRKLTFLVKRDEVAVESRQEWDQAKKDWDKGAEDWHKAVDAGTTALKSREESPVSQAERDIRVAENALKVAAGKASGIVFFQSETSALDQLAKEYEAKEKEFKRKISEFEGLFANKSDATSQVEELKNAFNVKATKEYEKKSKFESLDSSGTKYKQGVAKIREDMLEGANDVLLSIDNKISEHMVKVEKRRKQLLRDIKTMHFIDPTRIDKLFHSDQSKKLLESLKTDLERAEAYVKGASSLSTLDVAEQKLQSIQKRRCTYFDFLGKSDEFVNRTPELQECFKLTKNKDDAKVFKKYRVSEYNQLDTELFDLVKVAGSAPTSDPKPLKKKDLERVEQWKLDWAKGLGKAQQMKTSEEALKEKQKAAKKVLDEFSKTRYETLGEGGISDRLKRWIDKKKKDTPTFVASQETRINDLVCKDLPETEEQLKARIQKIDEVLKEVEALKNDPWPSLQDELGFRAENEDNESRLEEFMKQFKKQKKELEGLINNCGSKQDRHIVKELIDDAEGLAETYSFADAERRLEAARQAAQDLADHPEGTDPSKDLKSAMERWDKEVKFFRAKVPAGFTEVFKYLKRDFDISKQAEEAMKKVDEEVKKLCQHELLQDGSYGEECKALDDKKSKNKKRLREGALKRTRDIQNFLTNDSTLKLLKNHPFGGKLPIPDEHLRSALNSLILNISKTV